MGESLPYTPGGQANLEFVCRYNNIASNTGITIDECSMIRVGPSSLNRTTDNTFVIPYQIIGYNL